MRGRMPFPDPVLPLGLISMLAGVGFHFVSAWERSREVLEAAGDPGEGVLPDRASPDPVYRYLQGEGVVDDRSRVLRIEWQEEGKQ